MTSLTLLYITLAALLSALVAWLMYGYRSGQSRRLRWILATLRFVVVFLLLLLLINPKVVRTNYYKVKPTLLLLIDNSKSITYLEKESDAKDFISHIKEDDRLNDHFDLQVYTFGESLETSDEPDFTDRRTDLSKPLSALRQLYKDETAPTLLLTDGNQTLGRDYEFTADSYPNPIFPVALGDTVTRADLYISRVNTNRYAYLSNEFPVEVFAVSTGHEPANSELLIRQGQAILHREKLDFSPGDNVQTVHLNLPANRAGVQRYTAELTPLENERNTENNSRQFAVEVIDQATNVLIVSAIPHPDLGSLSKAITSNERRKAKIVSPEEALSELEETGLVVLYQPNTTFRPVFEGVTRQRLNSFIVTGTHTDWNFLNSVQDDFAKDVFYEEEEIQGRLNTAYGAFMAEDISFERFPPLRTSLGEFHINTSHETLLHQLINGIDSETPLLFTVENEGIKQAVLDAEDIWRWRMQAYLNENDFRSFDNFMGNLFQYLATTRRVARLEVTSESFYYNSGDIRLSARYYDRTYVFDPRASLSITIRNEETDRQETLPMLLKGNYYEVNLSNLPAGEYSYTVSVSGANISRSGSFSIIDYDMEQQFLNADVAKLERVAGKTDGTLYFPDEVSGLVSDLLDDDRFLPVEKSEQKTVSLVDWKILLACLALVLTLEWFTRKYHGMV